MSRIPISIYVLFFLTGCIDQAPLSVRTFVDSSSVSENSRKVSMEYLLREGSYCGYILIGRDGFNESKTKEYFADKLSIQYRVEIPSIEVNRATDLGAFIPNHYGSFFEGGYSFHRFSLEIRNIPSYRASAKVTATFTGEKAILDNGKFGLHFSEWSCK